MYFLGSFLVASTAFAAVERISTTSAPASSTTTIAPMTLMVWSTDPAGVGAQVPFSQHFSTLWSTLYTPKQGSIGLGSIDGEVGTVRTGYAHPAGDSNAVVTGSGAA